MYLNSSGENEGSHYYLGLVAAADVAAAKIALSAAVESGYRCPAVQELPQLASGKGVPFQMTDYCYFLGTVGVNNCSGSLEIVLVDDEPKAVEYYAVVVLL